jgi:hypothetical protein
MLRGDTDRYLEVFRPGEEMKDDGTELDRFGPRAEDEKRLNHFGGLTMSERDPALRQIIWREFHGHTVTRQNADAIPPQAPRQMGQNYSFMFQLYTEQAARKLLEHGTGYFDAVFFAQSNSFLLVFTSDAGSEPAINRPALLAYTTRAL